MSKRSEEAALKAYPVKQSYNDYYGDYEDINIVERVSFQEGYEQAEKDLGWISVKDRLPEKNGWYFTCVEQFKIPQCVGITYFDKKDGWWLNDIPLTERIFVSTIEIVDYWMKIPELPEEEEK